MEETQEEKDVREIVREAKEQIKELNDPARQAGQGRHLAPQGPVRFIGAAHYQRVRDEADKARQEKAIRQEALNKTAEAIKDAPASVQAKAYMIVDNFVYPNTAEKNDPSRYPAKQKDIDQAQRSALRQMEKIDAAEREPANDIGEAQASARSQMGQTPMKERGDEAKDVSESQDYAMRKLGDEKEKNRTVEPAKEEPAAKEGDKPYSFTANFSGVRYYQQLKEVTYTDHSPSTRKDRGPDLDR